MQTDGLTGWKTRLCSSGICRTKPLGNSSAGFDFNFAFLGGEKAGRRAHTWVRVPLNCKRDLPDTKHKTQDIRHKIQDTCPPQPEYLYLAHASASVWVLYVHMYVCMYMSHVNSHHKYCKSKPRRGYLLTALDSLTFRALLTISRNIHCTQCTGHWVLSSLRRPPTPFALNDKC